MYDEDKTILTPREEPEVPATPEIPVIPDEPVVPEIPAIPVVEEIPPMNDIPVMEDIPVVDPGKASGGMGDAGKDWMAIVSLVCGVLSLCGLLFAPVGCIFSIASVVLGIFGLKSNQKTLAIIGLVIGGIGVLLSIIAGIIWALALVGPSVGSVFDEILYELDSGY